MATMCLPVWGQASPEKVYPLTARLVARALTDKGMQTADEQVVLPARVVATEPYPALDILSVEPLPDAAGAKTAAARSTIKVACRTPQSCVPFFAIVTGLQAATTPVNPAALPNQLAAITMRAGTHAILVIEDQQVHIEVVVVTLENGATGKWIRVASPDRKQFYRAEVVSPYQLRGEF
jgi:hypothetical protein